LDISVDKALFGLTDSLTSIESLRPGLVSSQFPMLDIDIAKQCKVCNHKWINSMDIKVNCANCI